MRLIDDTRQRVIAFIEELERLAELEFPYPDSKLALAKLRASYQSNLEELLAIVPENDVRAVLQLCRTSVQEINEHLPYLGFILRSTDVRNAFEAFGPLLRLAGSLLEPEVAPEKRTTRLVMSSEWQYSPFVFHSPKGLSKFVLIGLPASESSNPLLLPLTGHELGHSFWIRNGVETGYRKVLYDRTLETLPAKWNDFHRLFPTAGESIEEIRKSPLLATQSWAQSVDWAVAQARETFCDFFGLRLFGIGFLKAFVYFLSPGFGKRIPIYPETHARVSNLLVAARSFGLPLEDDFLKMFERDVPTAESDADRFLRELADQMLGTVVDDLIADVAKRLDQANVALPSDSETQKVVKRFKLAVPAEHCPTVADILNAAWVVSDSLRDDEENGSTKERQRRTLRELCLKNLEVFEIEQRLQEAWRVQN